VIDLNFSSLYNITIGAAGCMSRNVFSRTE